MIDTVKAYHRACLFTQTHVYTTLASEGIEKQEVTPQINDIPTLPTMLFVKQTTTYIVYNQIKCVHLARFYLTCSTVVRTFTNKMAHA